MRTTLILILAFLFGSRSASQILPIKIDLFSNGKKLDARFYPAESEQSPTVVLLHGIPGNDNNPLGLAEKLNQTGINILVFNYQGTFGSEGVFNFDNCANDVGAAIDFLKQKGTIQQFAIDTTTIIICGYSVGGSIALTAAVHNPEIKNIIAIAGGNDQAIYLKRMADNPVYRTIFEQRITGLYSPKGPIKGDSIYLHSYFDKIIPDVNKYDLVINTDKLKNRKILFLTGWQDTRIPVEEYIIPVYRALKNHGSESVSIKAFDTDHYFGNVMDELVISIADWSKK